MPSASAPEIPAQADELQRRIDAHVAASDAFVVRHGLFAEDFGTL